MEMEMSKPSPSKIKKKIALIEEYLKNPQSVSLANQLIGYGEKDTSPSRLENKVREMRNRLNSFITSESRISEGR